MSGEPKVLLLSDSEGISNTLKEFLAGHFQVISGQLFEVEQVAADGHIFEFILVDFAILNDFATSKRNREYYEQKLAFFKEFFPGTKIILLASQRDVAFAGELLELGFANVLQIPFSKEIVLHRLTKEIERDTLHALASMSTSVTTPNRAHLQVGFETNNQSYRDEIKRLEKIAASNTTILITGESGTGKSMLARHIHSISKRKEGPFIEVHCGAISETLIESELFGHEKGAFTGAIGKKLGKFELANKGTIFLDEIGTVSSAVQIRLLQVLQERFIQRVGGDSNIALDIRIIAATNSDLKNSVKTGTFREDLFYRLNVFQVEVPPLRKRIEDLELITSHIIKKYNDLYSKSILGLSPEVHTILKSYNWPGNVRELENIIERAMVLESSDKISVESIPRSLLEVENGILEISPFITNNLTLAEARRLSVDAFEKSYLTELLIIHHGKVNAMARQAEVSVRQLHKLLAKHQIRAKDYSIQMIE